MDGGNWGILLDEYRMFELSPVPRFGVVFCRCGAGVFCDDDGLVVHGLRVAESRAAK